MKDREAGALNNDLYRTATRKFV